MDTICSISSKKIDYTAALASHMIVSYFGAVNFLKKATEFLLTASGYRQNWPKLGPFYVLKTSPQSVASCYSVVLSL